MPGGDVSSQPPRDVPRQAPPIEQRVKPGEAIVRRASLHPLIPFLSALPGLVAVALLVGLPADSVLWYGAAVVFVMGVAGVVAGGVADVRTSLSLTTRRVDYVTWRNAWALTLREVSGAAVEQGRLARWIGFGTVVVTANDGTPFQARWVQNPQAIAQAIERQRQERSNG